MKRAILLVAFGAGTAQARNSLRMFEQICRRQFPDWTLRWAYTSLRLRQRLAAQRQKTDSVAKALSRLHYEKFSCAAIQPLQAIPGREHLAVCEAAAQTEKECGMICRVGLPLLNCPEDAALLARALMNHLPQMRDRNEDLVFMGHGATHPSSALYANLAVEMAKLDRRIHIGAMSGVCSLASILPRLYSKRVWLMPLLSTIGQHALQDMAGPAPASWKSQIESRGHQCEALLKGLAEYSSVSQIWLDHLRVVTETIN